MGGSTIWFMLIGLGLTGVLFGLIAAIRSSREHEWSALLSSLIGAFLLIGPFKGEVMTTFGDAAAAAASMLCTAIFLGAWLMGAWAGYFILKRMFP